LATLIPDILLWASKMTVGHVSRVTLTKPFFKGHLSFICWGIAYLCTNFDHYNVHLSRYMVVAHQNFNRSHNLTIPLSEIICHMLASTYNNQPTYQIWTLYLCLLWRYKRRYKI